MRDFPEVIHLERSDGEVVWMEGTPDSEEAATAVYRLDTGVISDIAAERRRQIEAEGWTPKHDDQHSKGDLAVAAACYALHGVSFDHRSHPIRDIIGMALKYIWPWMIEWWKPKDRRRDLIRAAALIVAEIERLDRAANASASAR